MVTVSKNEDKIVFNVNAMHKIWALKSSITIDKNHIVTAYQDLEELKKWKGMRFPGTEIPFVIAAGTFFSNGNRNFWDVMNKNNTIIVELKDEEYNKIIVEVENPEETLNLLNSK
jgi:hypothetical protein